MGQARKGDSRLLMAACNSDRMRKKKKLKLAAVSAVFAVLVIAICIAVIVIGRKQILNYETQITDLQYELDSNTVTVYVASRDIKAGENLYCLENVDNKTVFEEDVNVQLQEEINSLPEEYFMSDDQMGSQINIGVKANEPIMASYLAKTTVSTDLREYEISCANLMTDQEEYDYVDVRILFPDGSDYLVLPKKVIRNLHLDNCVFYTYLNEDEILRFASAIIDAYTTTGTYIYTTRYVESSLQEEAVPDYPVRAATLSLLQTDPNILQVAKETLNTEARMNLATRLSLITEDQLDAVAEGFGIADTAKSAVFEGRIEAEEAEEESDSEEASDYGIGEDISEEEVTDGGMPEVTTDSESGLTIETDE